MNARRFLTPIGNESMYVLDTASWRVVRPVMDKQKCNECGICLTLCPVNSILRDNERKYYTTYEQCKGCGICAVECPKKAIDMVKEGGN